ncbi:MAG: hypothetical protein NC203_07240 [Firmicutes bacterium]|nr:hypothetical protein [[Eubacterium] siraeum]MCM1488144.1 hypothetical protein [Bacillota bacterium]
MSPTLTEIPNRIEIPKPVATMMYYICEREYCCYMVGDAVKNLITGEPTGDIDLITNADLDRLEMMLENYRIIEFNPEKGEMVVMAGAIPVMISSFRCENEEIPIPDRTLADELKMRDFTVFTICADMEGNIIDPFDGISCLTAEPYLLKAVGEEDPPIIGDDGQLIPAPLSVERSPLCLLQALILMGSGEYVISDKTSKVININAKSVLQLDIDGLRRKFEQILMSKRICDVFLAFDKVVSAVFPELSDTVDFEQHSLFHSFKLYEHLCKSVGFSTPDLALRYALLLHGVGKPDCQAINAEGFATYYGHSERSVIMAKRALERLNVRREVAEEALFLITHHDMGELVNEQNLSEMTERFSKGEIRKLLLLAYANIRAKNPDNEQKAAALKKLAETLPR